MHVRTIERDIPYFANKTATRINPAYTMRARTIRPARRSLPWFIAWYPSYSLLPGLLTFLLLIAIWITVKRSRHIPPSFVTLYIHKRHNQISINHTTFIWWIILLPSIFSWKLCEMFFLTKKTMILLILQNVNESSNSCRKMLSFIYNI